VSIPRLRGEGRWEEALALTADSLVRADLLNEWALFSGDAAARKRAGEELDRAEALLALGRGRILHAQFLAEQKEDPRELEFFERGLELARSLGDPALEAQALFWVGLVHQVVRGDHEESLPYFRDSFDLAEKNDDAITMSYAARHLGFVALVDGRESDAWTSFEKSVALRRAEGFLPGVAAGLLTLGEVAAEHGRPEQARELLLEARALAEQVGAEPFLRRIEEALAGLS
jgi:tetratricopeptide (TPR) repeat protein